MLCHFSPCISEKNLQRKNFWTNHFCQAIWHFRCRDKFPRNCCTFFPSKRMFPWKHKWHQQIHLCCWSVLCKKRNLPFHCKFERNRFVSSTVIKKDNWIIFWIILKKFSEGTTMLIEFLNACISPPPPPPEKYTLFKLAARQIYWPRNGSVMYQPISVWYAFCRGVVTLFKCFLN